MISGNVATLRRLPVILSALATLVSCSPADVDIVQSDASEAMVYEANDLAGCSLELAPAFASASSDVVPESVSRILLETAQRSIGELVDPAALRETGLACASIFKPLRRFGGPDGLELYVGEQQFFFGVGFDYFVLFDPRTGNVTAHPPRSYTKWSRPPEEDGSLPRDPVATILPSSGGQPAQLVIHDFAHNGTMYNAEIDRYFEIDDALAFTQVMAVEKFAMLLGDEAETTERTIVSQTPFRVVINTEVQSERGFGTDGSVVLTRTGTGEPFRVAELLPADGGNGGGLLTYCEKEDEAFLTDGCDFWY